MQLTEKYKFQQYGITILFLSMIISMGCTNPVDSEETGLQLNFQNNSSRQLNKITVSNKLIGSLQSGSSSNYITFKSFGFDTGMPDADASAEVDGTILTNHNRGYWCGTEKITIDSGKYLIEINIIDTVLFLSCKDAPTIFDP